MFKFIVIIVLITTYAEADYNSPEVWTIPKCCPLGYTLVEKEKKSVCSPTDLPLLPEYWGAVNSSNNTEIDVVVGDPCPLGKYRLEPEKDSADEFRILQNGSLFIPFQYKEYLNITDYCVEVFETDNGPTVLPLVCFPQMEVQQDDWKSIKMIVYPIGLLVSLPFLFVTLLIYLLIPELRDTQGKTLCCHISCLIVAYTTLATVQLGISTVSPNMCLALGFLIQFSFLACFFWLNVLCFDTWWRITSPHTYSSYNAELKKFLWYSIYAWSVPILLLVYTVIIELTPIIPPSYLKPNIRNNCWFANDKSALAYFYGPMGFLLIVNVFFFILSARHIPEYVVYYEQTQISLQINEITSRKKAIEMFKKCAELFVVMGLNWLMEILSWALGGPSVVWFVTDVINTLQGIIIFFIFVVQVQRVRRLLAKYYNSLCRR